MFNDFVALPEPTKLGIILAITAALGYLFSLIPVIGQFLQGYAGQIAVVLGGVLISYVEQITPDAYANVAVLALQLVLAVLAAFGVVVSVKNARGHYVNGLK
jgi:hypothetical protein